MQTGTVDSATTTDPEKVGWATSPTHPDNRCSDETHPVTGEPLEWWQRSDS